MCVSLQRSTHHAFPTSKLNKECQKSIHSSNEPGLMNPAFRNCSRFFRDTFEMMNKFVDNKKLEKLD